MKILIAASNMVHINNFHRPYIKAFEDEGHKVYIMARGEGADFDIGFKKRSLSFSNLKLSFEIKRILKKEEFDVVYLHTSLAAFWVRMAMKGLKKRPYVVNTVHGYLFGDNSSKIHNAVYLACEKILKKQTDDIVVMNSEDYEIATKNKLCLKDVYFSKGMGVRFRSAQEMVEKPRRDKISLAFVGEISKRKNQLLLVRAMKRLPEYTLTLVGDGDGRAEIEEYINKEGLSDRVFITGFTKNAYGYIAACDIYVSASNIEGLPFNIMEAMYSKKPIVASDIKGQRDLLSPSQLYPPGDEDAYVSLVRKTDVLPVEYDTERYSLDSILSENVEIYLKKQPTVAEKQPLVY